LAIDPIRELLVEDESAQAEASDVLVAYSPNSNLETALDHQRQWHAKGRGAVLELQPIASIDEAHSRAQARGNLQLDWVDL
jgi:ATP phosphoribosyltransferase regulatory subunit